MSVASNKLEATEVTSNQSVELSPQHLNNYVVGMREAIRQARVHLIHRHTRQIKVLSKVGFLKVNSAVKKSDNKKVTKLAQEIKVIKNLADEDLAKLVLLETKTLDQACRDGSSIGRRAVCRLAEHPKVAETRHKFNNTFEASKTKLPFCIKVLGTKQRHKKIQKLDKKGKKKDFLLIENVCFQLLKEIGGAEFAEAENLYNKLKSKKKKSVKEATAGNDIERDENKSSMKLDISVTADVLADAAEQTENTQTRKSINTFLDEAFGKWEDDGSSDSETEIGALFTSKPETVPQPIKIRNATEIKNSEMNSTNCLKLTDNEERSLTKYHHVCDGSSSRSTIESNQTKSVLTSTSSSQAFTKVSSKDESTVLPSTTKVNGAEVQQLDLSKMIISSATIQFSFHKRVLELNLEDEILCDLPKKIAYKRAKIIKDLSEKEKVSDDYILKGFNSDDEDVELSEEGEEKNSSTRKSFSHHSRGRGTYGRARGGRGRGGNRGNVRGARDSRGIDRRPGNGKRGGRSRGFGNRGGRV